MTGFAGTSALVGGIPGDIVAAAALFLVGSIVMVQNPEITVALLDAVTTYGVASQVYYFGKAHGKGERNWAGKNTGTDNPWKGWREDPNNPNRVGKKDPNGKMKWKPKPPDWPGKK